MINGSTGVIYVVGDPVTHVRSPSSVTELLAARNHNTIVVPAHVATSHLSAWVAGVSRTQNVGGIIVSVPHKFACFELCRSTSDRSNFLSSINAMRRLPDGSWHGDELDGDGFLQALRLKGYTLHNKRVLVIGAGGLGAAIGYSLIGTGISELAIHDIDATQRDTLVHRLQSLNMAPVRLGSRNPQRFDLIVDASPAHTQTDASIPIDVSHLQAETLVCGAKSPPEVTPLLEAAQHRGCVTLTGTEIFLSIREALADFILGSQTVNRPVNVPARDIAAT